MATPIRHQFELVIDSDMSPNALIEAGHYNWINNTTADRHLQPSGKKGRESVQAAIFRFDHDITSDKAIEAMTKAGYRPATFEELLAFGASGSELLRQFSVMALGAVCPNRHGVPKVACILQHQKGLWALASVTNDFDKEWSPVIHFLAIHRS